MSAYVDFKWFAIRNTDRPKNALENRLNQESRNSLVFPAFLAARKWIIQGFRSRTESRAWRWRSLENLTKIFWCFSSSPSLNMKISPLFSTKSFCFCFCDNVEHFRIVSLKRHNEKKFQNKEKCFLFLDNSECQNSPYTRIGSLISSFFSKKSYQYWGHSLNGWLIFQYSKWSVKVA